MDNKICVYTCITGDYDNLKEIKNIEKNVDYYCFTNNKKIKSKTWNVIYIEDKSLSNVLLARKIKILGNPLINEKYDILVWMDAAVEFKRTITGFVKEYLKSDDSFSCFKHGIRNSIDEEMNACLRFRKESIDNIKKLKKFYKDEKYKYDNGLIESTVFIKRPKDKKVIETMNLWFEMVKNYTKRDQLSFNYCISKTGLDVKWIDEKVFDNNWFSWHEHTKSVYPDSYMVYFGNIDDYDYKYQIEGKYKIINNEFILEEKIKYDTQEIYIELSNIPMIKYKVYCDYVVDYQNTIDYDNKKLFFKTPGFIIIKGDFKKGEKLRVVVNFETVEDYEKNEIIEYIIDKNVKEKDEYEKIKFNLNNITSAYDELKKSYDRVLNSTSWKITKPIRRITSIIKK